MPPRPKKHQETDPKQRSFFDILTSSHDGIVHTHLEPSVEPEINQDGPVTETIYHVDTRERAGHLLGALKHLANAAMNSGMARAQHTERQLYFAEHYNTVELNSRVQHARHAKKSQSDLAKEDFLRAYNLGLQEPVKDDDIDFVYAFVIFKGLYGVGSNGVDSATRRNNRDRLANNLREIMKIPGHKQPYQKIEMPVSDTEDLASEEDSLRIAPSLVNEKNIGQEYKRLRSIRKQLLGIRPIIPATYDEMHDLYAIRMEPSKNAHNALMKQYKKVKAGGRSRERENMANRAVASSIYRMDDYRVDAVESHKALHALELLVGATLDSPLSTLVNSDTVGMRVYTKHKIMEALAQERTTMPGFDPLRAQSVPAHPDMIEGIKDHQGNQYTGKPTLGLIEFVDSLLQCTTVTQLLEELPKMIEHEAIRADTWTLALREVAGQFRGFAQASKAVHAS